ncbi:hypothetical protein BaRGS_00007742 [Batillaria attramentaria]|uniref:Uncharacterized protein n=1 Tax=Batillaria attramentaria TaxID=370345 RepID=A0ABD0LP74_9CAEN
MLQVPLEQSKGGNPWCTADGVGARPVSSGLVGFQGNSQNTVAVGPGYTSPLYTKVMGLLGNGCDRQLMGKVIFLMEENMGEMMS